MGTGLTKGLNKTHGPTNAQGIDFLKEGTGQPGGYGIGGAAGTADGPGVRRVSSTGAVHATRTASTGPSGASPAGMRSQAQRNASPLGIDGGDDAAANPLGEDDLNGGDYVRDNFGYTRLEAIVGKPGSAAKYVKKRPIGKGAYGEAYIVERNPSYDPAAAPLAERQVTNNKLAHPTRVGGTYVIKVMDLRNMRQQDRQYAQTEIICIAHTHHFAIIRYYEHYVLDSGDETMVIVTEFADHGDLSRNLNRSRDFRLLAEAPHTPSAGPAATSGSTSSTGVMASQQSHPSLPYTPVANSPSSQSPPVQPVAALHLTEKEAGMYFVQLLAALHHIHKRRMIHRDVKSANLFLTSHGFIKLGDFGFSQKYESTVSSETIAGTFLGTPYYVSPEMWKGTRYGKKADVWAAGIVLYEMLMDGQRPFEAMGLTDLKRVVLERDVELPEYPPGADPAVSAGDSQPAGGHAARRGKFSPEIRELVQLIFQKDPQKRPSTEELLRTPIMQHYLFLFQRHVESLINEDAAKLRENPSMDRARLAFPEQADQDLVLQGIEEMNQIIKDGGQKELPDESAARRYEGVVYKGNRDGTWKERHLALEDDVLVISLSRAKSAAEGAERSRKVPMKLVKAVNMCQPSDPHVLPADETPGGTGYVPPCAFVLFMQESSSPIYFGVASAQELDSWMKVLQRALRID